MSRLTKNFASCRPRHGSKLARHSMMSSSQKNQLWTLSNLLKKKEEDQASRVPSIRSNSKLRVCVGGNFSPGTRPIFDFFMVSWLEISLRKKSSRDMLDPLSERCFWDHIVSFKTLTQYTLPPGFALQMRA